jgi:hypothetical protein
MKENTVLTKINRVLTRNKLALTNFRKEKVSVAQR